MSSMGLEREATAQGYARCVFAVGAAAAILEATLLPSYQGTGRTLFGVSLLLVSVSLACAGSCLAPSWEHAPPWIVRRRWAIGASVALVLGLILGGLATFAAALGPDRSTLRARMGTARSCWVLGAAALALRPGLAKAPKGPDAWVAQARIEVSAGRLDVARKYLETAIKREHAHADAHFLLCGVEAAEADRLVRGYGTREQVERELGEAANVCGMAAEHNPDPKRRSSILASRLRSQIDGERWAEAAGTFEALMAGAPDDGRLLGGYAAMLDRAGRPDESAAALERAATKGADFGRAARFEFVWDRYDRKDAQLGPMIESLRAEESDPRKVAILDLMIHANQDEGDAVMLDFLDLVGSNVLAWAELDRLWKSVAGPVPRGESRPWTVGLKTLEGLELPRLQEKTEPRYPEYERDQREEGRVELLARIEKDGTVGPIWVTRTSGPSFAAEAIKAVRDWRYVPARRAGEIVPFPWTIRVDFRLR